MTDEQVAKLLNGPHPIVAGSVNIWRRPADSDIPDFALIANADLDLSRHINAVVVTQKTVRTPAQEPAIVDLDKAITRVHERNRIPGATNGVFLETVRSGIRTLHRPTP